MSHPQARARLRAPCLERVAPGGVHIGGHSQQRPRKGPQHARLGDGTVVTSPGASRSGATSLLTGVSCADRSLLLRWKRTTSPPRVSRLVAIALRMVGDGSEDPRRLVIDSPATPIATARPMGGVTLRMPGEIPRDTRRTLCALHLAG